jgi:hypothetical protein
VRWWSAASAGSADKQGTPVQNRDGPAAVTERKKDGQIFFDHCPALKVICFSHQQDEKVRPDESSGVRRPTNAGNEV